MLRNLLILCCPLLLLPSIFPSTWVFSNESTWVFSSLHEVALVLKLHLQHQSFQWLMISLRSDWFHLLAVQGTLKSLLQYHSSKASSLQHSTFLMVQLSHSHMTTGKSIALTIQTFVGKVMSLLFNMMSRFLIVFLPRSKHLLISCSHCPQHLEPKKVKSVTVSIVSPSTCHEVMGPDTWS